MQVGQSSSPKTSRYSGFHLIATSIAALAGVGLAVYQMLMPAAPVVSPPLQVTVAVEKPVEAIAIAKGNADIANVNLAQTARFSAALADGADQRYSLASLFDGNPNTVIVMANGDTEINILVSFANGEPKSIASIEYRSPAGLGASSMDILVLPSGQMDASGQVIHSFKLPASQDTQSFALPTAQTGKAMWLRVAGQGSFAVGDFRVMAGE